MVGGRNHLKKPGLRAIALLALGLTGLLGNCEASEENPMSLTVELTIARRELLYQENPICRIVLKNKGNQAISVVHPMRNPSTPVLRLIDVDTGTEKMCKEPPYPAGEVSQPLAPGASLDHEFGLLTKTGPLTPGTYELSAICNWDGGERTTESGVLTITVAPCTPQHLNLVYSGGGWSGFQYGVSVNTVEEKPRLTRHTFRLMPGGGVADALLGPEVSIRAEPVLSAPRNQEVAHAHWVAWLQDGEFCVTYLDPAAEPVPVKRLNIGDLEAEIVAPLHFAPSPPGAERPSAAAMLLLGSPTGGASKFQVIYIAPDGSTRLGEQVSLNSARPAWAKSHERTDGSRILTYVAQDPKEGANLYVTRWPGKGAAPGKLQPIASWAGKFVTGGTAITAEDSLLGATLVLTSPDEDPKYVLYRWTLDKAGQFSQQEPEDVPYDPMATITRTHVRVSPFGPAAVLLRNDEGEWSVYDGKGNVVPAPGAYATTEYPLGLAFFGQTEPVLIAGGQMTGYDVILLDGKPLPHEGAVGRGRAAGGVGGRGGLAPK